LDTATKPGSVFSLTYSSQSIESIIHNRSCI